MVKKSKQECPPPVQESIGFFQGKVKDEAAQKPLAGVRITTNDSATYTDSEGKYLIGDSEALNPQYLMAYQPGYRTKTKKLYIDSRAPQKMNFSLTPYVSIPNQIIGTVKDSKTLLPIPGATVQLDPALGGPSVTTGPDGSYSLPCSAGSHQLHVSPPNPNPKKYKSKTVTANCSTQKDIQLTPS